MSWNIVLFLNCSDKTIVNTMFSLLLYKLYNKNLHRAHTYAGLLQGTNRCPCLCVLHNCSPQLINCYTWAQSWSGVTRIWLVTLALTKKA